MSKPLQTNRGVPQGSVLGPVLFILFINDMPYYLRNYCETLTYADDTTLLLSTKSPDDLAINTYVALNMAYQYCSGNDLVANPSKTKQIVFGRRAEQTPYIPDIERTDEIKFLGITIDTKLTWTPHIDSLSMKLNTSLYAIRRIKSITTTDVARTAYFGLFESHLRYGLAAWGGTSMNNLTRVLILQKRQYGLWLASNHLTAAEKLTRHSTS
uniref:Reverse transcriptase domain-containing protein n=2 Tax=Graphocephala atropunctata TaxID=36148 RepID=A0A1B6LSB3_9HEMI